MCVKVHLCKNRHAYRSQRTTLGLELTQIGIWEDQKTHFHLRWGYIHVCNTVPSCFYMGSGAQTQVLIIAWQALTKLASQTLLCFEAGSNYIAQADLDLVINVQPRLAFVLPLFSSLYLLLF